jgi:preprotein translocase subunit SecF
MFFEVLVTLGILSIVGIWYPITISPAVVGGGLVIAAYSCYDVVVMFRSLEDTQDSVKEQGWYTICNNAINQVITRSVNTTITTIVPVIMMLILGGSTLTDFAVIIIAGLLVGAYSTICLAMPLYTIWRARDLEPAKLNVKYGVKVNTDTQAILGYELGVEDMPRYGGKKLESARA